MAFARNWRHAWVAETPEYPNGRRGIKPDQTDDAWKDHGGLVAPMPGRVIAVLVRNGERVTAGTALVVMEAMKMEHTITAPADGIVTDIHFEAGEQVRAGDELLTLEPAS